MVRRNPPSARVHIGLGNVLLSRGQTGYALAQYAKALELSQPPAGQQAQLSKSGKGPQAGTLTIANSYAASALAGMGDAYLFLNEAPISVQIYESAVRENAFDATVQYRLARAYEYTGNFEEALATYDRALRLDRRFTDAASAHQILLTKQEVYDQAKRVYLTAHLSGQKDSADAYYGEAVMLRLSGRKAAAEAMLREAVNKNPTHFGANLTLGQMLSERGLHEEAFGNFSLAFAVSPTSAVAAKELALTSLILKDTVGAVQWAAKAYELAPDEYYLQFEEEVGRIAARNERSS
jgi:tetratricopeptide (TPR) repeat protein